MSGRGEGRSVNRWTCRGSIVFATAFSTLDPAFALHQREWKSIGRNSFGDGQGHVRTYLEPSEIMDLFPGWDAIHHREGMGPEHCHGNSPSERHAKIEAVLQKTQLDRSAV